MSAGMPHRWVTMMAVVFGVIFTTGTGVAFTTGTGVLEDDEVFTAPEFELTISDDSLTASNMRAGTVLS